MSGVTVVPAEVALVDRLDVMAERPVVAAIGPLRLQRRWQLELLRDLGADKALVHAPQGLVVHVAVRIALLCEELRDALSTPNRPVVLGEHDVGILPEQPHASPR